MKQAFDVEKYLELQSKNILDRVNKFDNKLYIVNRPEKSILNFSDISNKIPVFINIIYIIDTIIVDTIIINKFECSRENILI